MFDNLRNMAGLAGIMKDLPKLKAQFEEVKERLGQITVDGETGGGAVRATVNGQMEVIRITIDPAMLATLVDSTDPDDRTMAEDLIVGAVNVAMDKAKDAAEQEFARAAQEMNLPIPPGGLGGMLGA